VLAEKAQARNQKLADELKSMAHLGGVTDDDSAETELVATFQVSPCSIMLIYRVSVARNS
jgi:hypothetical protein